MTLPPSEWPTPDQPSHPQQVQPSFQQSAPLTPPATSPEKPRKSRKPLIISLIIVGVLLLTAAVATPFILGNLQHTEAVKEYEDASDQLEQARTKLANALSAAAAGIESSSALTGVMQVDRVADPAVMTALESTVAEFVTQVQPQIDALNDTESEGNIPASQPESVDEIRGATEQIRGETEKTLDEADAIDAANEELWEVQLTVIGSAQQQGEQLLRDAADKAGADELARLQGAVEGLAPENLLSGENDLAALIEEFNAAWDAVNSSMTPVWEDINGDWCDGGQKECVNYAVPRAGNEYTVTFKEMLGGCFLATLEHDRGPGANLLFCPAGVPEPTIEETGTFTRPGEPLVISGDVTRDRMWLFHAPGSSPIYR